MALSSIDIASRALIKLGAEAISGFDDGSAEATIAGALYGHTRDALLSAHPWSFATADADLAALAEQPETDYARAFQLPVGYLRVLSLGAGGRSRGLRYRIQGTQLHCDAGDVRLRYIFRADEGATPPFFDEALIAKLTAELCIPVTENTSRAELMQRLAAQAFERAKSIDAQQDTPQRFEDFTLIGARGR